jgi:nucleotide-binding universal stress UspA family protein
MEQHGTRINSIAVALDGTPLAAATIPFARELARSLSARVLVMSVIDGAVSDRFAEFCEAEDVSLVEAVRAYQAGLIRDLAEDGIACNGYVVAFPEASTSSAILELTDELDASLIVIGSHGRSGVRRAVLGSVAEDLIRSGNRPVLVVRPTDADLTLAQTGLLERTRPERPVDRRGSAKGQSSQSIAIGL